MDLSLFGRGRHNGVLYQPFWLESVWDPFESMDPCPARSFGQGARAVAGTKVDWLETDEAHIFKADLPGTSSAASMITNLITHYVLSNASCPLSGVAYFDYRPFEYDRS